MFDGRCNPISDSRDSRRSSWAYTEKRRKEKRQTESNNGWILQVITRELKVDEKDGSEIEEENAKGVRVGPRCHSLFSSSSFSIYSSLLHYFLFCPFRATVAEVRHGKRIKNKGWIKGIIRKPNRIV